MRWPSAHLPLGTRHAARHGCPIPSPFAEPVQHSSSPSQNLPVVSPQSTQGLGLQSTDRTDMRVPDLSSSHWLPSCSSSLQRRDLFVDMPDSRVHSGKLLGLQAGALGFLKGPHRRTADPEAAPQAAKLECLNCPQGYKSSDGRLRKHSKGLPGYLKHPCNHTQLYFQK